MKQTSLTYFNVVFAVINLALVPLDIALGNYWIAAINFFAGAYCASVVRSTWKK